MLSSRASRWFGLLILLMLGLRLGYKYYHSQQPSAATEHMANAQARQEALIQAIQADQETQRAHGAAVVLADSTALIPDNSRSVK